MVDCFSAEFRSSRAIIPRKRPSSSRRGEEEEEGGGGGRKEKREGEEEEGKERNSESSFHSLRQQCGENRDCRVKGTGRWRNIHSSIQLS